MAREFGAYDKLWNALVGRPTDTTIDEKIRGDLSVEEAEVLELRFGLTGNRPKTLDQTGTTIGAQDDDVRRIEALAIGKLRQGLGVQHR